jgi:5-methyltetrahydrofolate--homocysteine methyltransferase
MRKHCSKAGRHPAASKPANIFPVETIESIRLIKQQIPHVKTVLGSSNISFGLPAARKVVNSVFLYYCTKAGLDLAIVNAEKLERLASIP